MLFDITMYFVPKYVWIAIRNFTTKYLATLTYYFKTHLSHYRSVKKYVETHHFSRTHIYEFFLLHIYKAIKNIPRYLLTYCAVIKRSSSFFQPLKNNNNNDIFRAVSHLLCLRSSFQNFNFLHIKMYRVHLELFFMNHGLASWLLYNFFMNIG